LSVGQGISLAVSLAFSVVLFFLGLFFIRTPQAPTRFFSFGMFPDSRFGNLWFRCAGYLFCAGAVGYWILTPFYLIAVLSSR
jgi:hypothetical protein